MRKTLNKFGGLILFYGVIIGGVLLLNLRFSYLNNGKIGDNSDNLIAMNN